MPVILATWETDIGRVTVASQPRQKSVADHISMKMLGMVTQTVIPARAGYLK
jgi:hypothetical protein